MKIREDFVTNSSSSSYIICFARVADKSKAQAIIDKHCIDVFTKEEVEKQMHWGYLGAEWAGATIFGANDILVKYPDDEFIIIEDSNEGIEHDWDDIEYDYNFSMNEAIDNITEEHGFDNIEVAQGEGRDG